MAHTAGTPRLPEPQADWSASWMRDFIRVMQGWMQRVTSESHEEAGAVAVETVTSDTVVALGGGLYLVDASGGEVRMTLPDPGTVLGREFTVKRLNSGSNRVVVDATDGSIDRSGLNVLSAQYDARTYKSDGTEYWIVSSYTGVPSMTIMPSTGSLTITGVIPAVHSPVTPGTGSLTLTGAAPTVS